MVGTCLLEQLAASLAYRTIYVAGRRRPSVTSDKVRFVNTELSQIPMLALADVDDVFCALGTTIKKAGSQAAFRAVDCDAVVELGQWAHKNGVKHFAVVSSIGADAGSGNFYLRTKGQMEQRLGQLGLASLIVVRPSLLLGNRGEFRFGEKAGELLSKAFSPLMVGRLKKYKPIKAIKVACAMVAYCESQYDGLYIVESDQLQHF